MNTIGHFSSFNPNFGKTKNSKKQENNFDVKPLYTKEQVRKKENNSFLFGAICAATILSGINGNNNQERDSMLSDIATELEYTTPNDTRILFKDMTEDNVTDIILEDKNGLQTIYDLKNKHMYQKDENSMEKIY